ncbi:MAG TPA: hypothetical protein DCR43_02515 [Bacteroidales bacterium]|nr:MAG: hypothetical protein A2X11_07375 [Bacteroidetes bacterium GWE2_42_24]OFY29518.1 MAG: hypothetical protein A2X09_04225 [Bacteroidetes bacterium GWF2_43_11]PKP27636.1 MAG: hypothetical protein CVU06_01460 [Bacteroidetes bacterium HGW-Bacteroidetes-22]HAQ64722.1 hypothetical protein [Bacteroidales bacterium]HBZ67318.1 hypothetical protein [Bacteroidales bacterium]
MRFLSYSLITLLSAVLLSATGFSQNTIEGYLLYHNDPNKPIPGSEVTLTSLNGGSNYIANTDNIGKYVFTNVPDGTYQLTASTTISAGGVTLGDSYLILLHLLGFNTLSPIQQIAADVTGNGQIGWDDYTTIISGWFLNGNPFPVGEWAFDTEIITTGLKDNTNLGGTSAGDVNGGYIPNLTKGNELYVAVENDIDKTSTSIQSLSVIGNLTTTGFGVVFDLSPKTQITNITSALDGFDYIVAHDQLRVTWINKTGKLVTLNESEPLFTIQGKNLELAPSIESHFIDSEGNIIPNITLKASSPVTTDKDLSIRRLYQSGSEIIIECYTYNEQNINVIISDMSGRTISSVSTKTIAGLTQIKMSTQTIPSGIYTCNIASDVATKNTVSKKFFINN